MILEQFGNGSEVFSWYQESVLGVEDGLIDWAETETLVIGDGRFKAKVRPSDERKGDPEIRKIGAGDLIELVSSRFAIKPRILMRP